jgi:four helix bundle protein
LGSAAELEYYVVLASDLSLLEKAETLRLTDAVIEVKRMVAGLIRKLTDSQPDRHSSMPPSENRADG